MKMKQKDKVCSFCGKQGCYAHDLCIACYERKRRTGSLEYKGKHAPRPGAWSDMTRKILELRQSGMRQVDIVQELGTTKQNVSRVIKDHAKPTNFERIHDMDSKELAAFLLRRDLSVVKRTCDLFGHTFTCDEVKSLLDIINWLEQEVEE